MTNVFNKIVTRILLKRGFSPYCAQLHSKNIIDDLTHNKQNTIREKIWAHRRGFFSSDINNYGLTEQNYKQYLSSYDYYKLHPLNGEFGKWIDDKLTIKYLLYPYKDFLPKYYYHLKTGGIIIPLMDADNEHAANGETIIELLKSETNLAVKLIAGQGGVGFYKISFLNNLFYINNTIVEQEKMLEFICKLEGCLITEYVTAHHEISRIFSLSANTARIMVINEDGLHPFVANAIIRFGTQSSGSVDNISAGGFFSIIDIKNGNFSMGRKYGPHFAICETHPDTQVKVSGTVPNWDFLMVKIVEIAKYLVELNYMGFDVVVTEEGFKILEINSFQGMEVFQYYYPLLINNDAAEFFKKLVKK